MLNYLENLRKKPERERRKAVFMISLSLTIVVMLVWGIATFISIKSIDFSMHIASSTPNIEMPNLSDTYANFMKVISSGQSASSTQTTDANTNTQ